MRRCARAVALTVAALILVAAPAAAIEPKDLVGTYECKGTNPDGGKYDGTVEIKLKEGKLEVHWKIGKEVDHGEGVLEGGTLTVHYKGGAKGRVAYLVEKGGDRLVGTWKPAGTTKTGTETLIKKK
jgi:hypothetical protein